MRITSLGSGSSGNAYLVEAGPQGRTRLLVDAGFPARVLSERLLRAGCSPRQLRGVLVTHEHSDHIIGLPFLLKRHGVPVYANARTLAEVRAILTAGTLRSESGTLIRFDTHPALFGDEQSGASQNNAAFTDNQDITTFTSRQDLWRELPVETSSVIGDIEVYAFPVSHDAVAPCGYVLSAGGCRVCIITDSGEVTPVMLAALAQADLLILEANHDRARLLSGPYPYHLKQRILSATGHLSNDQAAEALLRTWRADAVRWLWLAHLSRTNNTRKLALTGIQESLRTAGAGLAQLHISVLGHEMGGTWDSTRLWHDEQLWEMP